MSLKGKKVAVLSEKMFQEMELYVPYYRLLEEGAEVVIIGLNGAEKYESKLGYPVKVDADIKDVNANDFDGVVVPGGFAPDFMRVNQDLLNFVRSINEQGKMVATICHGGWVLASAEIIEGKKVTAVPNIKDDLQHAGATYVNEPLVIDGNIITSRVPKDIPQFCKAIVQFLKG